jgi:hypothetical protein
VGNRVLEVIKKKMVNPIERTDNEVEKQDLEVLSRWVKKTLFGKVKFIYRPEVDLKADGDLFWLFVKDCKGKLQGLSRLANGGSGQRRMYLKMLWAEATKKPNRVSEGLSIKRSTVYTSMHNQWVGKYQHGVCVDYYD